MNCTLNELREDAVNDQIKRLADIKDDFIALAKKLYSCGLMTITEDGDTRLIRYEAPLNDIADAIITMEQALDDLLQPTLEHITRESTDEHLLPITAEQDAYNRACRRRFMPTNPATLMATGVDI